MATSVEQSPYTPQPLHTFLLLCLSVLEYSLYEPVRRTERRNILSFHCRWHSPQHHILIVMAAK